MHHGAKIVKGFRIEPNQKEFYLNLFAYFKGLQRGFDLNKGILLCGSIGTGKTTSMQVMQSIFRNFPIINTRYVVREYMTEAKPPLIIDKYGRMSYMKSPSGLIAKDKPLNYCFDDFGLENVNVKNYGNDQNIMEEILLDRYDEWKKYGLLTFGTSNLDPEQIEKAYGGRVRDRIKEMMNYISIVGESKRK